MSSFVRPALRRLVVERASGLCEYCLIHEDDAYFGCEVEHIISEKHGGATIADNLAYACVFCNRYKGSDIATIAPLTGKLTPLFNPRVYPWSDHFELEGSHIRGKTEVGDATAKLLQFNTPDRVEDRSTLIAVGRYPSAEALSRMHPPPGATDVPTL
jgi:hypothetical protein